MAQPGEKNISAFINPSVSDRFSEQTDNRGQKKYRALEGSIRLWLSLPSEVQALLIANPEIDIDGIYASLAERLQVALRTELAHEKRSTRKSGASSPGGRKSLK